VDLESEKVLEFWHF